MENITIHARNGRSLKRFLKRLISLNQRLISSEISVVIVAVVAVISVKCCECYNQSDCSQNKGKQISKYSQHQEQNDKCCNVNSAGK